MNIQHFLPFSRDNLLLSKELQGRIQHSTCLTLVWAVLYNSMSLLSCAARQIHVNDRWRVIYHCLHLDTQEEITNQPGCVTSCLLFSYHAEYQILYSDTKANIIHIWKHKRSNHPQKCANICA